MTFSNRLTPPRRSRPTPRSSVPPSAGRPCKPTWPTHINAPFASPRGFTNSNSGLSEALGDQAWHESGLSVPDDIDRLKQQIGTLEQHTVDLRLQLEERDDDLAAARAANRELMAQLNGPRTAK